MASIVLRSVGTAAGNALLPGIGGMVLGALGRSYGGVIDGALGLGGHVTGPRLENLSVQDSRYGAGIPLTYGCVRTAGNVIWSTDLIEAQHNSQFAGGKGGFSGSSTTTTTYTYSVHCAVGIALGPIGGLATIWADSTVIYQNGVWTAGVLDSAAIYTGTATQNPDPFMQSMLGSGNVPAYRGLAYIVLENLQLANFGNRLPNLTFEIVPVAVTNDPTLLSSIDAQLSSQPSSTQQGGMLPIAIAGSSGAVRQVLVGGFIQSGSNYMFEVVSYDVSSDTPVELNRVQSASFSAGASPSDNSWAMAPDGRFVAMYFQASSTATHYLALYDSEAQQFGPILTATLDVATAARQIGWIDATHFVVDDAAGTARGLHAFARSGLGLIDLGFTNVWGASTAAIYKPMGYAQYTQYAGGLMHYIWDTSVSGVLTIYARPLLWSNGALSIGASYTLVAGLALGSGSNPQFTLTQIGDDEWVFCYATSIFYRLFSFAPAQSSATITRPWQIFNLSIGTGSTNFPIYYGDRLVILQRAGIASYYSLSEVTLDNGAFTLALDCQAVGGLSAGGFSFCGLRLDSGRMLVMGSGGFISDIGQLGILQRAPTGGTLAAIIGDLLNRAGYANGDYDVSALEDTTVSGYLLNDPMAARAAIEPLQVYAPFDLVETSGILKAVPRSATVAATIASGEWRAANDKQPQPPGLREMRAQELDLPLEVDVDYIDPARDFEVNSQRARRIVTHAQTVQKISLPIVCAADLAKQIAETRLYTLWNERALVKLTLSRAWLAVDASDVIDLGNGSLLRVTSINQAGGLLTLEGFYVYASSYASAATADTGQTTNTANPIARDSTLYLLDLPLLQATDDQPGVYAAATGLAGWKGASIWRAADGVNYSQIGTLGLAATAGIATSVLPAQSACYPDNASSVTVQLTQGTLSSCSRADLLNGANAALLGGEIIQFQTATLVGPGLYQLSQLLRGRRATESAMGTHFLGENFVLLTPGAIDFLPALLTDRGRAYDFRALTNGQSLSAAQDNDFTYGLETIAPFAPVNIQGARASGTGSDLTLVWKRRARLNADWVDYIDVPLDEPTELYEVDIMNGASAVRTFSSVTAPTVTYTAAEQASDWPGGVPATFTVNVYQLSSRYGRGNGAVGVV